jgi:hypothetical protein
MKILAPLHRSIPVLPPDWGDKRFHFDLSELPGGFQDRPVPLSAVYVLGGRQDRPPVVSPLSGQIGLMTLVENSFAGPVLDRDMRARDLDVLGRLASRVALRSVCAHANPANIAQLCQAILEDFSRIPARVTTFAAS